MKNRLVQFGREQLFMHLFREEKKVVLKQLDQLEDAIYSLQFEGKMVFFSRIKTIESIMKSLKKKYKQHVDLDDRIIFPFLEGHIPRLSPILRYLKAERQEFEDVFAVFDKILLELIKKNEVLIRNDIIVRLKDKGVYLICLMRSHIQIEEKSLYDGIFRELHPDERSELVKKITQFSNK